MKTTNIEHISEIGNKAYNLLLMQKQNITVPKSKFLTNKNSREIDNLYKENKSILEVEHYLDSINFFEFENTIGYPLIVRSSSTNEDNENQSNAGKYLSIYNILNRCDLIDKIIKCWNSKGKEESMGVIIQEQLFPYYSGVAFIYSNNGEKELIIELVIGLGELLVSGYISPMRFKYDFENDSFIIMQNFNQKLAEFPIEADKQIMPTDDIMIFDKSFRVLNIGNNVFYVYLMSESDYCKELENVLISIKEECLKVYDHNGDSDIEWVYTTDNNLYIVQRRPISRTLLSLEDNKRDSEYGGTTIVPGIRKGKLVHLKNYKAEKGCIVFAPTILPKDFSLLMRSNGIISIECSLLSHSSILARELQLPYWAGVQNQLFIDFENQNVLVDFFNRNIELCNDIKSIEVKLEEDTIKNDKINFNKVVFDIATFELISEESKTNHDLAEAAINMARMYYDEELINSMKLGVII